MLLEVKHNSNKVQSAMEQLFEGFENIQKLFKRLDISPWKLIGAFYYERRPKKKNIKIFKKPCFVHSDFVIKKDQLNIKLERIEQILVKTGRWTQEYHVEDFVKICQVKSALLNLNIKSRKVDNKTERSSSL